MWHNYKKTTPLSTPGIKASKKRGAFGESWWAKRWIAALESFHVSSRLQRGRRYARQGQVTEIDIQKGRVNAQVQGSRKTPYSVSIEVDTFSPKMWQLAAAALSKQAIYIAKLMAREMPDDIEQVFNQTNIPLLPTSHHEIHTNCNCPDWSNPCKHVAAVYYLLAEEFDRDPFLIFRLRGIEREEFFGLLEGPAITPTEAYQPAHVPLTSDQTFWRGRAREKPFALSSVVIPINHGTLPESLGKFPFWKGQRGLQEFLEQIYAKASARAYATLTEEHLKTWPLANAPLPR